MSQRVLVACVGNIFLGDDGFGVEAARRLSDVDFPDWVRVCDYGIRGMHLAYDIVNSGYELTILVDATQRGDRPGTVYVVEMDTSEQLPVARFMDAHGMQPDVVLGLINHLGGDPGRVLLVGCEPESLDDHMGLSPTVERAVDTAVRAVVDLVAEHEELTCALAFPAK